jgi:hypothetical protein
MSLIEYKLPIIVNSDPESGAVNISDDGSSFEIELEQPIYVPRESMNCYITVQNFTFWFTFYNVDETNNKFDITYFDGILFVTQSITIDPGLYDMDHLNQEIVRQISKTAIPTDVIQLQPSTSDQKSVIRFNYTDTQIDFNVANSLGPILGFDLRDVPLAPTTTNEQYEKSDSQASFNAVNYVLLHSDLISKGIRVNDKYNQTIAQALLTAEAGKQVISEPQHIPEIPSNELRGEERTTFRFWITDENDVRLNTRGETYSARLVIHYTMKVKE